MFDASDVFNPVVGWRRWTELTTFTAASAHADYPATNLGALPLANIWQSTADTGQWIKGQLDQSRGMRLFVICRHNFSNAATFRLRIFSDAAATQAVQVYDSDADADLVGGNEIWPVVYGDELEWEDDPFIDGKYTDEEKRDTIWYRPILLPEIVLGLSFRFDFDDADNADGVFKIGMIDVSQAWQFSRGAQVGASHDFEVRTRSVTAYGGVSYHERLTKKRTFQLGLSHLPRDEAKGVVYELMRQHDLDVPFAFVLDPRDTKNWLRDCSLVKNNAKLSPLARAQRNFENVELNFIEAF